MERKFNNGRGEQRSSGRGENRANDGRSNYNPRHSSENRGNRYERSDKSNSYGERKPYNSERSYGENRNESRSYENRQGGYNQNRPNSNLKDARNNRGKFQPRENNNEQRERSYGNRENGERNYGNRENSSYNRSNNNGYERRERPSYNNNEGNGYERRERPNYNRNEGNGYERRERPSYNRNEGNGYERRERPSFDRNNNGSSYENRERRSFDRDNRGGGNYGNFNKKFSNDNYDANAKYSQKKQVEYKKQFVDYSVPMRLNKFLANSGMCSRREADEFIQAGVVSVNGNIVTELGSKLTPDTDQVHFHDQLVKVEKKVYILLNKPKNCVTTAEDTHDRLTVLDLVKNACSERVYPVGRLDRNTTGVLLITNDGDLTSKLTHPKYDKKKIYQITLDKPLAQEDFEKIGSGITLEDGDIKADDVQYVNEDDRTVIGIEIHSGKNRIVRRIFDHLGYHVIKLDRVYFAGLTKKNLPRGKWRYLSEMEVTMLKMGANNNK